LNGVTSTLLTANNMQLLLALLLTTSPKVGLPAELPLPSEARKHQQAPAVRLMYQWDRDDAELTAPFTRPLSNRETWTGFAHSRKLVLPTKIVTEDYFRRGWGFNDPEMYLGELICFESIELSGRHSPWLASLLSRFPPSRAESIHLVYSLHPSLITAHDYCGSVDSVPHLFTRAKSIEALEAKLLELYCDYVTNLLADDLQPAITPPPDENRSFIIANGRRP
jgi:hypothetical protein